MLSFLLLVDTFLVVYFLIYVLRRSNLFNPSLIYLFFHGYAFTLRGWAVALGDATMYEHSSYQTITHEEIFRGLLFADMALVLFFVGFALSEKAWRYKGNIVKLPPKKLYDFEFSNISILLVVILFLPIAIFSFFTSKFSPTSDLSGSGYIAICMLWIPGIFCLLIYSKGLRWFFYVPLLIYISTVALQGYHRVQLIIPLMIIYLLYCNKQHIRFPNIKHLCLIFVFISIFPFLKDMGKAYQSGDLDDLYNTVEIALGLKQDTKKRESYLLDQYSGAITMFDEHESYFYGSTYLAVITLPVPRFIYPDKPGLGDHIIEVSTSSRPYNLEGRVIAYIGEAYANFWVFGVIIVPFILGWFIANWYRRIEFYKNNKSANVFLFIIFYTAWIQVFRDGLSSFIMFGLFYNLPVVAAYFFSKYSQPKV